MAAGIICEYNPIHQGHVRHIKLTKELIGQDCPIVCVMSGNFVQRGDAAVFDKHTRAHAAILAGADLVIELPAANALSSAEHFARAAVFLLHSFNAVKYLSFGSESGNIDALCRLTDAITSENARPCIKTALKQGLPYAQAIQHSADVLAGTDAALLKSPNNLLAVEYIKALRFFNSNLKAVTVKRTGPAHDSKLPGSASALRTMLKQGDDITPYIPHATADLFKCAPMFASNLEIAVLSRLRALQPREFLNLPNAAEGLGQRLMQAVKRQPSLNSIITAVKTKRYSASRIRRMIFCACLGIKNSDSSALPPYIRLLAMNNTGLSLLKAVRNQTPLPVITKPASVKLLSSESNRVFETESHATDFYALGYSDPTLRRGGTEWLRGPIVVTR